MPPNTVQTVKRYQDAFGYAPSPGFPARWAPGTGPKRATFTRNFHAPVHYSAKVHKVRVKNPNLSAAGLGDVSGTWDDIVNAGKGVVGAALQPVSDQAARLESAIKIILVLSGIAAGTGVLNMLRR